VNNAGKTGTQEYWRRCDDYNFLSQSVVSMVTGEEKRQKRIAVF
jgi:hypothetical protein